MSRLNRVNHDTEFSGLVLIAVIFSALVGAVGVVTVIDWIARYAPYLAGL